MKPEYKVNYYVAIYSYSLSLKIYDTLVASYIYIATC